MNLFFTMGLYIFDSMKEFTATVISVDGDRAVVALELHEEACEVCRLSSVCMRPGECVLEVGIDMSDSIVPGNPVVIRDAGCSASRMMLLGLLLPLGVLVGVAVAASWIGMNDVLSAVSAVMAAMSVYAVLYLMRRRAFPTSDMVCESLDCRRAS